MEKLMTIAFLFGLVFFLMPASSFAQEYPIKPINLTVTHGPAGVVDTSTRILASKAEKFLGQPFVITNNANGAGTVAVGILVKEKPDGYHLASGSTSSLLWVPFFRPVTYKLQDIVPIVRYAIPPSGLLVKGDSPWKTFQEFVEYAKKNPGKVSYSISGANTTMDFAMQLIAKKEGIRWGGAIPYPSGDPNYLLLGGHVTACSSGPSYSPYVKAGTLRLLAVYSSKRMKNFPAIPTIQELGYDFIDVHAYGVMAPKLTPAPIIKKLEDAFRKGMEDPEFVRYTESMELEISYLNSEDAQKYLEEAYAKSEKLTQELGVTKEPGKK